MPVERRGPAVRNSFTDRGGGGEMIKAPVDPQDLGRGIYTKGKADPGGPGGVGGGGGAAAQSAAAAVGRISLDAKRAGERCTGNPSAPFDVAGVGNVTRGAGLRPTPKGVDKPPDPTVRAPALDPTGGGRLEKGRGPAPRQPPTLPPLPARRPGRLPRGQPRHLRHDEHDPPGAQRQPGGVGRY